MFTKSYVSPKRVRGKEFFLTTSRIVKCFRGTYKNPFKGKHVASTKTTQVLGMFTLRSVASVSYLYILNIHPLKIYLGGVGVYTPPIGRVCDFFHE